MTYTKSHTVTAKMVRDFSFAVGDHNPIHYDPDYAATTRFKKPIAHGALIGGLISAMLVESFGEGTIYVETHLKFLNPVYVDDVITIEMLDLGRVKGKFNVISIEVKDVDQNYVAVQGSAEIIPGDKNA